MFKLMFSTLNITVYPLLIFLSMCSGFYIYFNGSSYAGNYTAILPVLYSFFILGLHLIKPFNKNNIFILFFIAVSFGRYVLHPLISSYLHGYIGRSHLEPSLGSYIYAINLMIYELLVVGFLILYKEYKGVKNDCKVIISPRSYFSLKLSFFIFFVSVCLLLVNINSLFSINFIFPTSISNDEGSTLTTFISFFFVLAKNILTINLIVYFFGKYECSEKNVYVYLALFFAFINLFVYMGTNRTDILVNAIVLIVILNGLYGEVILKWLLSFVILVPLILGSVTAHREYVDDSNSKLVKANDYLQTYFGGIYNVAISVEIEKNYPEASELKVLAFDFLRPTIGIGSLVKHLDIKYSNIYFNDRMWRHVDRRSQILPMLGQGNLFFGSIGAPLLSLIFVFFAYYLIKLLSYDLGLELKYLLLLTVARLGFLLGQNSMNLMNDISMNLMIFLIILFVVKFISRCVNYDKYRSFS